MSGLCVSVVGVSAVCGEGGRGMRQSVRGTPLSGNVRVELPGRPGWASFYGRLTGVGEPAMGALTGTDTGCGLTDCRFPSGVFVRGWRRFDRGRTGELSCVVTGAPAGKAERRSGVVSRISAADTRGLVDAGPYPWEKSLGNFGT